MVWLTELGLPMVWCWFVESVSRWARSSLGKRQKKPMSYGPVHKVLCPPPHKAKTVQTFEKNWIFFLNFSIFISKDAELSKTYVFDERKKLQKKIQYLKKKIKKNVFSGYPCKHVAKYFCIFFRFRTFCIFFSFSEKKDYFGYGQGVCPPSPWLRTGL